MQKDRPTSYFGCPVHVTCGQRRSTVNDSVGGNNCRVQRQILPSPPTITPMFGPPQGLRLPSPLVSPGSLPESTERHEIFLVIRFPPRVGERRVVRVGGRGVFMSVRQVKGRGMN